jgi:hypothetical protein
MQHRSHELEVLESNCGLKAFLLYGFVILSKLNNLSKPQFLHE